MSRKTRSTRNADIVFLDNFIYDVETPRSRRSERRPPQQARGTARPGPSGDGYEKNLTPRNRTQGELIEAVGTPNVDIVFALGPAGTGKTFLAVSMAVDMLKEGKVSRIILSRPAVEAGEKLGYMPGDMQQKIDPYMRPIYDVLHQRLGPKAVGSMMEHGIIEVAPLAFMRGRNLGDSAIIVDEAQNATRGQLQMVVTRFSSGSKMIICGDPGQTDILPEDSGLAPLADALEAGVSGVRVVRFTNAEVVRHPVVRAILDRIGDYQAAGVVLNAA